MHIWRGAHIWRRGWACWNVLAQLEWRTGVCACTSGTCKCARRCEHARAPAHLDAHTGVSPHMPVHIWECTGVCTLMRAHPEACTPACTHRRAHLALIHTHVSCTPRRVCQRTSGHTSGSPACVPSCMSPSPCLCPCRSRGVVAFRHRSGALPHAGAHPAPAQVSGTAPGVPCCPPACHSPCRFPQEPPGRHLQGADGDGAPADPARGATRAGGAVPHHQRECPLPTSVSPPLASGLSLLTPSL